MSFQLCDLEGQRDSSSSGAQSKCVTEMSYQIDSQHWLHTHKICISILTCPRNLFQIEYVKEYLYPSA